MTTTEIDHPAAPDRPRRPAGPPPKHKIAAVTWLAAYPTITAIIAIFEPLGLLNTPVPIRTLLLTAILIPAMVYVLVPLFSRLLGSWLRR